MSIVTAPNTDISMRDHLIENTDSGRRKEGLSNISLSTIGSNHYEPGGLSTQSPNITGISMKEVMNRNTLAPDKFRKLIVYVGANCTVAYRSPSATCAYQSTNIFNGPWTTLAVSTYKSTGTWISFNAINYSSYTYVLLTNNANYGYSPRWYYNGSVISTSANIFLYSTTWTTYDVITATAIP